MDKYPKMFSKAAMIYLVLGISLGVAVAIDPSLSPRFRFVHIHLNLLGFMIMMIAGVAYHVLPRFNARPVPWPEGLKYHFILQNAGLIGMSVAYPLGGFWETGPIHTLFVLSAVSAAAGLGCMIYNMYGVLLPVKEVAAKPTRITVDMIVGDVLDAFPQALAVFVDSGFTALANPVARQTVAKAVSIDTACKKHGVAADEFVRKLNVAIFAPPAAASIAPVVTPSPAPGSGPSAKQKLPEEPIKTGLTIQRGETCKGRVLVGSLIKAYPETKPVFEKHYGEGCFSCAGQTFETVEQTAEMHNLNPEVILKDINSVIVSALAQK